MEKKNKISRRQFLVLSGGIVGAGVLACSGLTTLAVHQPAVEYKDTSYGMEEKMNQKVLIVYASRAGSTGSVADQIGKTLSENGLAVDVCPVKKDIDVNQYDAVVLGSAIYMGQWMKDEISFLQDNQAILSQRPVAYFTVCQAMKDNSEDSRRTVAAYLDPIREIMQPVDEGFFAGALNYSRLPILYRLIAKGMKQEEGDWRNWKDIITWSEKLATTLKQS